MPKKIPPHLGRKAGKCIFCGGTGLTRTHIWPAWLARILDGRQSNSRIENIFKETAIIPGSIEKDERSRRRQGGVFSPKPYLTCETCNTGWMRRFEDEMLKFSKPIFLGSEPVTVDRVQMRVVAVWISIITILAEYQNKTRESVSISSDERAYLKKYLMPPPTWSIFVVSLDGPRWHTNYRHHSRVVVDFSQWSEYLAAFADAKVANTQISSFGIGKLFFQVFSCPYFRWVDGFNKTAKAHKLIQLWPIPSAPFWRVGRSMRFPTNKIINDEEADRIADDYHKRMKLLMSSEQIVNRI